MRMRTRILILCGVAVISVMIACAATKQWQYNSPNNIIQIYADGKGGCAVATTDTNNLVTVVWLDKKGKVLYESPLMSAPMLGLIQSCSANQLTYTDRKSVV